MPGLAGEVFGDFPDNGQFTGNFGDFGPTPAVGVGNRYEIARTCRRFPCSAEQGIFSAEQGIREDGSGNKPEEQGRAQDSSPKSRSWSAQSNGNRARTKVSRLSSSGWLPATIACWIFGESVANGMMRPT